MYDKSAVAIIGMDGRFPGARDLDEYWANLRAGVCSITTFSTDELLAAGLDPAEIGQADYVPAKGFLPEADRFEAELFGVTRSDAALLDPQHRLLLQTAWRALEDAGYDPRQPPGRVGVYVGGGQTEHMVAAHADRDLVARHGAMHVRILTDREFLAPWLSYRLGLTGPSVTVQTACSTSLTAVHLAAQALLLGECDTALAGGVSVDAVHPHGYRYQPGGILSRDGRCRPFDRDASGTVPGNGVGVLVLRRLADALADADPIRAVVLGSAVTNDGRTKLGFTAPGAEQQTTVIAQAWAAAGLHPSAAQYLELHGTGTDLGDRVELAATAAAYGQGTGRRCGIGSVKSNLGHLDAAAGAASLIKTVLMLNHRLLVPTANVTAAHPDLGLAETPFDLLVQPAPWHAVDGVRLAGVTGLGIGGTNVHIVLGEAPGPERGPLPETLELLPLSARTPQQLRVAARRLADAVRPADGPCLADVAYTLRAGRAALPARAYVLATDRAEAARRLAALADGLPPEPGPTGNRAAALRALGEAWVAGEPVAWPPPTAGARRIHLPTYPFDGDRYGSLRLGGPGQVTAPADSDALTPVAAERLLAATFGLSAPAELEQTFFAAGGDSLTAVSLIGRLRDSYGVEVPIDMFLEPITLRELAVQIAEHGKDDLVAALLDEVESR